MIKRINRYFRWWWASGGLLAPLPDRGDNPFDAPWECFIDGCEGGGE